MFKVMYYSYNRRAFKSIDTQEKAYWLGFISADGNVYINRKSGGGKLSIALSSVDESHLYKFLKFIESDSRAYKRRNHKGYSNNTEVSHIEVSSIEMVNDLIGYGVIPRKSLILKPPALRDDLIKHYIRGFFDGDGSIYTQKRFNKNNERITDSYYINFTGTLEILEWIQNNIGIYTKMEQRKKTYKNTYYFRFGGNKQVYRVMSNLYKDSIIHLDRKYEKYETLESLVV